MSLKFNTLYDFDNINNDLESNNNNINTNNINNNTNTNNINNNINSDVKSKTFKEKEGISEITKNFIRNALNEDLINNENQKMRINPSNFSIENQNLYTMFKLEYTLINDFLIRTKLNFTRNIFNNEMKSILKPLIPLEDGELSSLLGLNLNKIYNLRFQWNKDKDSNNSEEIIKSTYLYHILNMHTKIMKIDSETQTDKKHHEDNYPLYEENNNDIDDILKKFDEKYEQKKKEKNAFFEMEKKFGKYKEEMDLRYETELKNEIERFKTVELSQMRIEENKKYLKRIENLREEYQEEYNKKYEIIKNMKKELQEKELKLYKEFEERNNQLKKSYEEKEKILEEKKLFLEKKYKNDKNEASIQIIKFNEELSDLKKSFIKSEKEKKINNLKNDQELNPVINSEIKNLRNQIEEIKNSLLKRNNFIREEDKTNNININFDNKNNNSIKPSKKSVINNLEQFTKNNTSNNNNYINNINLTNRSSNSQSGSGAYNSNSFSNIKAKNKKDRLRIIEKIEEEEYQLNNKFKEEFMKIIHDDSPILMVEKEFRRINQDNNDMQISKYKPNDIENIYVPKNYNDKLNINKVEENININKDNINNNINKKEINNKKEKIIKKKEENDNNNNNNNIGGFNIGGFNLENINNKNNNLYNYPIKVESGSIIEENLEGIDNNNNINSAHQKKESNNISKRNNFKYQDQTNPIKEEIEGESGGSNNNSKDIINNNKNNINNNININKSNNKFNNYDLGEFEIKNDSKNDEIKNEGEIEEEIINYGLSGGIDDLSGKRKDKIISASISGIAKKQYEISESAGGFRGLLQIQGLGGNAKDEFEFSKGKNNNNNNNMNQKTESGKISEEIESDGGF